LKNTWTTFCLLQIKTNKVLMRIAEHIEKLNNLRQHLITLSYEKDFRVDASDLCGACAISAYITYLYFRKRKFSPKICVTETHCFIEIQGYFIDLTATQFGIQEEILIMHRLKFKKFVKDKELVKISYFENIKKFNDLRKFRGEMCHWYDNQNPFALKNKSDKLKQIIKEIV